MLGPYVFDLTTITDRSRVRLSPGFRSYLLEAAQFCLDHNGSGLSLGDSQGSRPQKLRPSFIRCWMRSLAAGHFLP